MNFKTFAIAAATAGAIALSATSGAQAANLDAGFTNNSDLVQLVGGKRFNKRHFRGRHFGGHWGHWGHNYNHGFRGCGWFYKKAKWTGSHYWWKKYKACKYGWY